MAEVEARRDAVRIDLIIEAVLGRSLEFFQAERLFPHLFPTSMNGVIAHIVVEGNVLDPVGRLISHFFDHVEQHLEQDGRIDGHEVSLGNAKREQANASTPTVVVEALQLVIVAHHDMGT